MRFDVLGLGESLNNYTPTGNKTIGVNDIWSRVKTGHVVCVDLPNRFTPERLKTIINSNCEFYTPLIEWEGLRQINKIALVNARGSLKELDSQDKVCYSNNSAFVACVMAWKLGAKELYLYGVDFNTHPNFKDESFIRVINDFKNLYSEFQKRGVEIYVTKESVLSEFIPAILKHER